MTQPLSLFESWRRLVDDELDAIGTQVHVTSTIEQRDDRRDPSIVHAFVSRPRRDLFGLALSGGGIRSATFNLGFLQGLYDLKLLGAFDYLSTVSGGGYIGAFWSAWRTRPGPGNSSPPADGSFPTAQPGQAECSEVQHLRRFSNFLAPNVAALSYDTGRMIVALLSGTIPAVAASVALVVLFLNAWLGVVRWLLLENVAARWSTVVLCGMLLAALIAFEAKWRANGSRASVPRYAFVSAVAVVLTGAVWYVLVRAGLARPFRIGDIAWWARIPAVGPCPSTDATTRCTPLDWTSWRGLLAPVASWGIVFLVFVLWNLGRARSRRDAREDAADSSLSRVMSRLLFMIAAWSLVVVVWMLGAWAWVTVGYGHPTAALTTLGGLATTLSGIFAKVQKLLGREPNKSSGGRATSRLGPRLLRVLASVILLLVFASVVMLDIQASERGWLPWLLLGAVVYTLLMLFFFNPREIGLHAFYRGRLARAYLGASNPVENNDVAEVLPDDDLALTKLVGGRPFHLVCCSVNDLDSSEPITTLRRGAVSGVLSRVGFSVGSAARAWSDPGEDGAPSLASAITASGAAFNSQMGSKSASLGPAVTFLLTTLNLRLGLWLPHPTVERRTRLTGTLRGFAFYRELFGATRATGSQVHLSDGGHFENMGLFELLRRHCRYVVASDCGADPDVAFDDFGNLVRRAREDLGVEIDIDLSPLRPRADGYARQPMVAGDIHYPNGDVGILLVVKPTLVGNEPVDVQQYHQRNQVFPHESTGDQFYDEAQWEAYRRLGVHAARSAFRSVAESVDGQVATDPAVAARLFAYARRQWLPTPEGLGSRLPRLTERAAALDLELQSADNVVLQREVYGELRALHGESPRRPAACELGSELGIVREALLFMEEAYVSENLERYGNHPLYLGLINYFARWTHAPAVRAWWTVLRPLHAERFARYLEGTLGLIVRADGTYASARLSDESDTTKGPTALATHAWRSEQRNATRWPASLRRRERSLIVPLRFAERLEVQIALVRYGYTQARSERHFIVWDAKDFFVTPGLWGAGIGETLLDRMMAEALHIKPGTDFLVRIGWEALARPAARKEGADLTQMYRAAGFLEVQPPRTTADDWDCGGHKFSLPFVPEEKDAYRWLWSAVDPKPRDPARRPSPRAG